jgi:hypothetical protein
LTLGIVVIFTGAQGRAAAEEPSSGECGEIKTQLASIDKRQKEILDNQEKIFDKLDQLRIWVHRK